MNELLIGLIGAVGVPLVLYLWQLLIPRKNTKGWGYRLGRFLTLFGRQKVGVKGWERLEDRLKSTVGDFVEGVYEGLDSDEATT